MLLLLQILQVDPFFKFLEDRLHLTNFMWINYRGSRSSSSSSSNHPITLNIISILCACTSLRQKAFFPFCYHVHTKSTTCTTTVIPNFVWFLIKHGNKCLLFSQRLSSYFSILYYFCGQREDRFEIKNMRMMKDYEWCWYKNKSDLCTIIIIITNKSVVVHLTRVEFSYCCEKRPLVKNSEEGKPKLLIIRSTHGVSMIYSSLATILFYGFN